MRARQPRIDDCLTRLLLPALVRYTGAKLAYPDRISRAEARELIEAAKRDPKIMEAFTNREHPAHAEIELYKSLVEHYAFRHAPDSAGEPEPWPYRSPSAHRATEADPFAGMTHDEAEALMTWAETQGEYRAALLDPAHPQHQVYVEQVAALHHILAEDKPSKPAGEAVITPTGDAGQAVAELRADPHFMDAYMNKGHAGHAAAVERMQAAYRTAYPDPVEMPESERMQWDRGTSAVNYEFTRQLVADDKKLREAPGMRRDGRVVEVEISRLRADPAYMNKGDPRHAEAVAAVTAAYQTAYPEPASSDGAGA